jgi:hypothetical protein
MGWVSFAQSGLKWRLDAQGEIDARRRCTRENFGDFRRGGVSYVRIVAVEENVECRNEEDGGASDHGRCGGSTPGNSDLRGETIRADS